MKRTLKYSCSCDSCGGKGIYEGMCEGDGIGVVCTHCGGKGYLDITVTYDDEFKRERRKSKSLKWVLEANPGYGTGKFDEKTQSLIGGMPYDDWFAGKPFPPKSEMRNACCPREWAQRVGGKAEKITDKWQSDRCLCGWFKDCPHFGSKAECWEKYDREMSK